MRRIPFVFAAALVAALDSIAPFTARAADPELAVPQHPTAEATDPLGTGAPAQKVNLNLIDQKLAVSLAVDTHAQIEFADFALKGFASDALRRYLTVRLERQHAFAARLDALTNGRTREAIARALREIEEDKAAEKSQGSKLRLLSLRNASAMLARIRLEILQEYTQALRAELATKSAEEFDRHYLSYELANQMQMLAALRVFENQASDDFALVINEAWTAAKEQLDRARQLLLQLETAPLAESAAKPALAETIVQPSVPAQKP